MSDNKQPTNNHEPDNSNEKRLKLVSVITDNMSVKDMARIIADLYYDNYKQDDDTFFHDWDQFNINN